MIKINPLTPPESIPPLFRYLPMGNVFYSYVPVKISAYSLFDNAKEKIDLLDKNRIRFSGDNNWDGTREMNFFYSIPDVDQMVIINVRDYAEEKIFTRDKVVPIGSIVISNLSIGDSGKLFLTMKRKVIKNFEEITGIQLKEASVRNVRGENAQWYV